MHQPHPSTKKSQPARTHERLGAHVSTQGGVQTAPARGVEIGGTAIQIFTKTPNQWREPALEPGTIAAFREAYEASGLNGVVSHDST
jgi:endonuclease IV